MATCDHLMGAIKVSVGGVETLWPINCKKRSGHDKIKIVKGVDHTDFRRARHEARIGDFTVVLTEDMT